MFYDDAIITHNLLDLNWMGGAKKYHVGFPEKAIDKYVPILVNHGYRVAVVEQTETPRQLEKRLKQTREKNADKWVMRDLWNVYTKGTYFDVNDGSYEPKWILSFGWDFDYNVGVVFFDITTLKLHIGQFKDNQMFGKFRTLGKILFKFIILAMQLRPTEIVYDKSQARPEMIKILTNSPVPPVKSALSSKMCYNSFKAIAKIEGFIGENKENWPNPLADLSKDLDISEIAFSSMGMAIAYLENCMNEHLLKLFDYHLYDPSKMLDSKMILDSQALEHLQILEVRTTNSVSCKGSLLYLIDDTRTPFGKRLLKKWVSSPLVRIEDINSRLDSIEDLIDHPHEMDVIRTKLLKLNDIEKQLSKLYQYSINRNK